MKKAHGQLRRGQLLTTYGPGALFDLPRHSAIIGGLDAWPKTSHLEEIIEPRLVRSIERLTDVVHPKLYAPPAAEDSPGSTALGVGVYRFPEWFVVQEEATLGGRNRARRLVHRKALSNGRFEKLPVVATRFVAACSHGHLDDLDWRYFAHRGSSDCRKQLWLDELGTSGDLGDLVVRCECGKERRMSEASNRTLKALGTCKGRRPWLGPNSDAECTEPARLLIRTASNAYFAQVLSVLSIPERDNPIDAVVDELWDDGLCVVREPSVLSIMRMIPKNTAKLEPFSDDDLMAAIARKKSGEIIPEKPIKQVELDAILAAPEGYGDDVPLNEDFHARCLPKKVWHHSSISDKIAAVYQLHRLREVMALIGFTRFEAIMPDINGEYEAEVERAEIAREPSWFPAVENRGEGIFIQIDAAALDAWRKRAAVKARIEALWRGHELWKAQRKGKHDFPGDAYILLHSLSHLLLQSVALRCGYPMSAIRERIYTDYKGGRYGILLYTGSPDSAGTLGGLVQQARAIEEHLDYALRTAMLCSNDPICAQHTADDQLEGRWLLGAACHGCTLIGESSCEMRNDYLDRALVVPVLGVEDAAFFSGITL
ncbi:hypothetical protein OSCT_2025 [Oscillochloris trichoides DG-6]|uniref:MrfA-like Zn-binding domain-containing protein n=1 Tax=Oscillochloris trichoides DG-6 TaxID=765420 RepID=E1IFC4_9CHLR|nr:DUF1998 domain-containing protein [Oscillochloris trichoides]EFO80094.1 hypothetical protein OSCT_2025 [Oscillochloris trichoides DG-6]